VSDLPRTAVARTAERNWHAAARGPGRSATLGPGQSGSEARPLRVVHRGAANVRRKLFDAGTQGRGDEVRQALSVLEAAAALPGTSGPPYRAALTGLRRNAPRAAGGHRAQVAGRRPFGPAGESSNTFDDGPSRGLDRPSDTRRSGPTATRGRGQDPLPGSGQGAAGRPEPACCPGRPLFAIWPGHGRQALLTE